MENKKWQIFVVLLIVSYFIAYLIVYLEVKRFDGSKQIEELEKKNAQLQKKFDSLTVANKNITIQLSSISSHIDTLNSRDAEYKTLYEENEKQIQKLKRKVTDLSRIDTFSSDDIKKYFSNLPE